MKKIALIVLFILVLTLFVSCYLTEAVTKTLTEEEQNLEGVKMTAIVKSISDKIEVEVIEGEYGASGIYMVNFSSDTVFTDSDNVQLTVSDVEVGDVIEITYSGQVMLSYPPQIVALKVQIK